VPSAALAGPSPLPLHHQLGRGRAKWRKAQRGTPSRLRRQAWAIGGSCTPTVLSWGAPPRQQHLLHPQWHWRGGGRARGNAIDTRGSRSGVRCCTTCPSRCTGGSGGHKRRCDRRDVPDIPQHHSQGSPSASTPTGSPQDVAMTMTPATPAAAGPRADPPNWTREVQTGGSDSGGAAERSMRPQLGGQWHFMVTVPRLACFLLFVLSFVGCSC
jgi:hypothetical protein